MYTQQMPTTITKTLSLHDALPIYSDPSAGSSSSLARLHPYSVGGGAPQGIAPFVLLRTWMRTRTESCTGRSDRKSTRLNSSHSQISYAVFCLKKKTH